MGIEDFKRWHWIAIGLLLGLGLSYAWTGTEREVGRNNVMEFLRDISLPKDPKIGPVVRRIVIHPPEPDFRAQASLQAAERKEGIAQEAETLAKKPPKDVSEAQRAAFVQQKRQEAQAARAEADALRKTAGQHQINVVTYERLMQTRDGKTRKWVTQQFIAEIPFRLTARGGGNTLPEGTTIQSYLEAAARQNPDLRFSYAWWGTKPVQYAIWTIGSVIVVGICWPNVLNAMIGAGYGRKHESGAKKKDSLWSYKSKPEPQLAHAKAGVAQNRAAQDQELRDMTDKLEHDLAARAGGSIAPVGAAAPAAAVRKLDGGPLETAPAAKAADDDEIEVKGEYYPVLIHHKKTHQDEPAASPPKYPD